VSARIAWEIALKPVLMLIVVSYAIVCIPLGVMFWQDDRRVAALPVVAVADAEDHVGQTFRGRSADWRLIRCTGRREIKALGKVIDEIADDQRKYYGLHEADFPQPGQGGRVMVLLTTP
jgi:hypothetical protein